MNKLLLAALIIAFVACKDSKTNKQAIRKDEILKNDSSKISLPQGFSSTIFADDAGQVRHIVVNSNGDLYAKLGSLKDGSGITFMKDNNNDGKADIENSFGDYAGTGIAIKDSFLYATSNTSIYRYKMVKNAVPVGAVADTIVSGLIDKNEHNSKSIVLDNAGNIYVNIGAPSNSCQEKNREKGSLGINPCPILDSAGGIWMFKANIKNQTFAQGVRYATGTRNIVGLDWNNQSNDLYAMQHGRDDLDVIFPEKYTEAQRVELPAEEFFRVKQGMDGGWPYAYYDGIQKQKVLAPEYGGDGKSTKGVETKEKPIYAFPAHWAPMAVLFYTGNQFPDKYKNGAFISFHGSWNRAPQPQAGFNVVFLPFKNGMPNGEYEIFADNFAGNDKTPDGAKHRPCGLAQGPDGSLYISDDSGGRIYKITYKK